MKGQKPFEEYRNLALAGTLRVRVEGDTDKVDLDAYLVSSTSVVEWDEGDLVPGPAEAAIERGRNYMLTVRLAFLADATVAIRVEIVKSDAAVHSQPIVWKVSGTQGETAVRTLWIRES